MKMAKHETETQFEARKKRVKALLLLIGILPVLVLFTQWIGVVDWGPIRLLALVFTATPLYLLLYMNLCPRASTPTP